MELTGCLQSVEARGVHVLKLRGWMRPERKIKKESYGFSEAEYRLKNGMVELLMSAW